VWIDGSDLSTLDEDGRAQLRGRMVGFVFQSFQLLPALTALENVMLPLELLGGRDAGARARDVLERVGLGERLGHYPRQNSGGEQQASRPWRGPFVVRSEASSSPTSHRQTSIRRPGEHVIDLLFQMNRERGTDAGARHPRTPEARHALRAALHIAAGDYSPETKRETQRPRRQTKETNGSGHVCFDHSKPSFQRSSFLRVLRCLCVYRLVFEETNFDAMRMLRRNWSAGELRVLLIALLIAGASVDDGGVLRRSRASRRSTARRTSCSAVTSS
jgi:hypothetical protein